MATVPLAPTTLRISSKALGIESGPAVAIPSDMVTALLPLVAFALGTPSQTASPAPDKSEVRAHTAQLRLAEVLAEADEIVAVSAADQTITFAIVDRGAAMRVVAKTSKRGIVSSLVVERSADDLGTDGPGALTWLGEELAASTSTAITRLSVDDDGAILVTTNQQQRYLVIPGRGSGGRPGGRPKAPPGSRPSAPAGAGPSASVRAREGPPRRP